MISKYSPWRRRDPYSLPKMIIRPQLSWRIRGLLIGLGVLVCVLAVWWAYGMGRGGLVVQGGQSGQSGLAQRIEEMNHEREKLLTNANAAESKSTMEHAAQAQLMKQVKTLETENIRLKEDLAFFESLMPADKGPRGLTIQRLKADSVVGNQLRYRVLVMQGGRRDVEFNGSLQLVVMGLQAGRSVTLMFPDPKLQNTEQNLAQYKVSFKHYQRLEGVLSVPEGMQVKALQARVLERGQMRAQQSANL